MLLPVHWRFGCYVLMDTMFPQVPCYLRDMACSILIGRKGLIFLSCSVDPFTQLSEKDHFSGTLQGCLKDIGAVLELFRASEIIIHREESVLEKQNLWTRNFLRQELSNGSIYTGGLNNYLGKEVVSWNRTPFTIY